MLQGQGLVLQLRKAVLQWSVPEEQGKLNGTLLLQDFALSSGMHTGNSSSRCMHVLCLSPCTIAEEPTKVASRRCSDMSCVACRNGSRRCWNKQQQQQPPAAVCKRADASGAAGLWSWCQQVKAVAAQRVRC
jgi:hypothetical protein